MNFHSPILPEFSERIQIGGENIGKTYPCYIIAEAGSNHGQDLGRALELVDIAADSGCDAVKFQTFSGTDIAAGPHPDLQMPREFARWGGDLREFYRKCALPKEFHEPLAIRAEQRGITFLSSPFGEWAVDFLLELGVPAFKIASFELVHLPLIRYAASKGLPLILSTGLAGLGDIERALMAASEGGCQQLALLHCGSNYPLGPQSANLSAIATMRQAFGVPVGYSDHTLGEVVPTVAVALGADIIEKHFTCEGAGDAPDHDFALQPEELASMVKAIRTAEIATGSPRKRRQQEENIHCQRGRRSLFAARSLKAGQTLTADCIKIVRPGTGIEPMFLELLFGHVLVCDVEEDSPLKWEHFLRKYKDDVR